MMGWLGWFKNLFCLAPAPRRLTEENVSDVKVGDTFVVSDPSGPNARPCNVEWIRDIARQCRDARTAFFLKQLGSRPESEDGPMRCSECGDVTWDLQHRDIIGANDANTFCINCGKEERPLDTLRDPKGGDISEFPEDLRVREFPEVCNVDS